MPLTDSFEDHVFYNCMTLRQCCEPPVLKSCVNVELAIRISIACDNGYEIQDERDRDPEPLNKSYP